MAARKKKSARGTRKRRGNGEAMTEAKQNSVEVRSIGDNSQLAIPEPDDWNHHKRAIKGWREKVTTAQSGLRNAIKAAKKSGVNMESLNMVVGIERQNDPTKTMQFFQQVDLGLSLSDETSIRITPHDTLAGDQEELVEKRFYQAGKDGKTFDCRYPENSELHSLARTSWMKGQAELMGVSLDELTDAQATAH